MKQAQEAVTMALYISLSLLAVMVALPDDIGPQNAERPVLAVFFTGLSLILAHALAFRLSSHLFSDNLAEDALNLLLPQLVGGLSVTAIAILPLLIFGAETGVVVSELMLVGFIGVAGYFAGRAAAMSRLRATVYVASVVAVALAVIWLKSLVPH